MRLTTLRDIDSDKLLISEELNNGDWPFRYVLRVEYVEEWGDNATVEYGKYCVSVLVVSPVAAKQTDAYQDAMRSCGLTAEQITRWPLAEYEMLVDYGVFARLWESSGNNIYKLTTQARGKLKEYGVTFGFAMDQPENACGATGWDFVRGDAALQHVVEE